MRNLMISKAKDVLSAGLETAAGMGAQAAKLRFRQEERIGCEFENARLKSTDTSQNIAFGAEVLVNGRRASASGNNLDDVGEIVSRAVALAAEGSVAHFGAYPAPGEVTPVKMHSQRTVELSRQTMVETCQAMVDALKDYNAEMFIAASADRSESESLLVTSGGVCHETTATDWSLATHVQRTEGTDMLFAGSGRHGVDLDEKWNPDWIVEQTLDDLRNGEKLADPPAGKVKTLLPPRILARILGILELGINGRNVAKGDSPLRGRLGEKIFDGSLTVVDDPHCDFCCGSQAIDNCGIPTRKMPIVAAGVLENFLYDLDSAGLADAQPTGHAGCMPYSLTVVPGQSTSSELLEKIDEGIVVKELIGFGQGNIINGDFSCNLGLGFRVRGGKIVGRVKDTMLAGNFYDLLAANVELSSDVDPVYRMPFALIEGVNVAAG